MLFNISFLYTSSSWASFYSLESDIKLYKELTNNEINIRPTKPAKIIRILPPGVIGYMSP